MAGSIYWHDYEAWGADPRQDRASQFAGIRTDLELNDIGEPLMIYCQPPRDRLPHPRACLITGITPQYAQAQGLPEAEFVRLIHQQFTVPQTCVAGYNSIRFDDELSRQLLYRNFHDPYKREWKNGNSRWDIIDMLRLCHAVRPQGINWPTQEDGYPVFRLERLSEANGLQHAHAHDALSDVRATIALARMVRQAQPKLYDFVFDLRAKQRVQALVDLKQRKPLLHVSALYSARNACVAVVMPLAAHPLENNGVLMFDLSVDPTPWLHMNAEQLQQRLFSAQKHLPEGENRLPVSVVHSNRCPALAPLSVLDADSRLRLRLDSSSLQRHWEMLRSNESFIQALVQACRDKAEGRASMTAEEPADPDLMLYRGGFFSDADRRLMVQLRQMSASELAQNFEALCARMHDARLPEMLFRYRARNFPSTLSELEQQRWKQFCIARCLNQQAAQDDAQSNLASCRQQIQQERELSPDARSQAILDELEHWLLMLESWAAGDVV